MVEKILKSYLMMKISTKFFRTGLMIEQSISISGGTDKDNIFLSLGNTDHKGVIKNNDYNRKTFNISATRKFNDYIKLNVRGKYSRITANRIQQNSNVAGLLLGYYRTPADFDITDYTGTYVSSSGGQTSKRHRTYRNPLGKRENPGYNNPLWTVNEQKAPNVVNRHIYSAELDVFPMEELNLKVRGGVDTYSDERKYFYSRGSGKTSTEPRLEGALNLENLSETEWNLDVIGKYDTSFSNDINASFILGFNINDRKFNRVFTRGSDFIVNEEFYNLSNTKVLQADNYQEHIRSNRGYTTVNFGLYDQLYFNLSGTLEAASTIKDSFFYPSTSIAWQFSEYLLKENDIVNFGKIRISFGKVGIQPQPYKSSTYYEGNFSYLSGYYGTLESSAHGGGYRLNSDLGNSNLKPEIKNRNRVRT